MAKYRVHINYNRPMYGTVYLETPNKEEVTDWTMDNFCYNNLECLSMEEDFHTEQTYEIEEYESDEDYKVTSEIVDFVSNIIEVKNEK